MLKRLGIALLVVAVLAVAVAGVVLAQDPTPEPGELCPFEGTCGEAGAGGYGMGGHGRHGMGMWGSTYAGTMPTVLADALGMTVDEFYAARADGQTVAEIASVQGVELADVVAAALAPRADALAQAVADGRITQEQADTMLATMAEHMTQAFETQEGGYGGCGMMGGSYGPTGEDGTFNRGGRRGGMMGGRWSSQAMPGSDS